MRKVYLILGILLGLSAKVAEAQLPANPWSAQGQAVPQAAINNTSSAGGSANLSQGAQAAISNGSVSANASIVDAARRSQPTSWRGSGQFSKLNYVGEVTTYDKAQGQEMLAPEVNNHNMNVMVQHLRDLGYNIPASYDNKFSNFLQDYSTDLQTAYSRLGRQNNPADTVFNSIVDAFEHFTGLDVGNLMFNSLHLIERD